MTAAAVARARPAAAGAAEYGHVLAGVKLDGPAQRLAALLDPSFLSEAGWDPADRVLSLPAGHRLLGRAVCRAGGCATTQHTGLGGLYVLGGLNICPQAAGSLPVSGPEVKRSGLGVADRFLTCRTCHTRNLSSPPQTERRIPRLVFLISKDAPLPRNMFDVQNRDRQDAFRERLANSGLTCSVIETADEPERKLHLVTR